MLAYYAERFRTVEINYTFYRIPTAKLLEGWADGTPDGFTFTLKAPRRITHDAKLQRCEDLHADVLPDRHDARTKLGVLLFQLPPNFKKDARMLRAFLELLPDGTRAAFEFRHASWLDDEVFDALRAPQPGAVHRRQREDEHAGRSDRRLRLLPSARRRLSTGRHRALGGRPSRRCRRHRDAFVYFKHEEQGKGPEFAQLLMQRSDPGPDPTSDTNQSPDCEHVRGIRNAIRSLLATPGFMVIAVLTHRARHRRQHRHLQRRQRRAAAAAALPRRGAIVKVWTTGARRTRETTTSPADFLDIQQRTQSLEALAGYREDALTIAPEGGEPVRITRRAGDDRLLRRARRTPPLHGPPVRRAPTTATERHRSP